MVTFYRRSRAVCVVPLIIGVNGDVLQEKQSYVCCNPGNRG